MSTRPSLPDLEAVNRSIRRSPYNAWMGIEALCASVEEVRLRVPWRPEFVGSPGMIHGGIIACIVDVAVFAAIYANTGRAGPTMDMRVDFYANVAGEDLFPVARAIRAGRNILHGEVSIHDARERLLASGHCVYFSRPGHMGT